ncbi:MAG: hypothetical protein LBK69_04015 [Syntrophomonadaceae bacterium]|nr:hypothetical protein [Syntrophomonadaceae bacterium]
MKSKNFKKALCGCLAGACLMFSPLSKEAEAVVLARFRINGNAAKNQRELLTKMVPGAPENCVITDDPELDFHEAAGMGLIEFGCPEDLVYFVDDIGKKGYIITDKYKEYYNKNRKDGFDSHKKLRARWNNHYMSQPAGFNNSTKTIEGKQTIGFGIFNSQKGFNFDKDGNLVSIDPKQADVIGDFGEMALGGAYFNCRLEIDKRVPARMFQALHMRTSAMEMGYDTCISENTRGGDVFGIDNDVGFMRRARNLKNLKLEYREYGNLRGKVIKGSQQVEKFVKDRYARGEY